MYNPFQQDFIIKKKFTTVLYNPEPICAAIYYHLKFKIDSTPHYLIMTKTEDIDWELFDRQSHDQFQDYELPFANSIVKHGLHAIRPIVNKHK